MRSRCRSCGAPLEFEPPVPRDAECPECGHDVRSCINCRHYDPAHHNACRETEADEVVDKHHRNFCEFMELAEGAPAPGAGAARESEARARLERMFGGGTPPGTAPKHPESRAEAARRRLRELFGDEPKEPGGS